MHFNPHLLGRLSPHKDEDATPAPALVKIRRKHVPVLVGDGGRLKFDQEMCDDMWKICKNRMHKEIVACMSHPVKAKAGAFADKTREHVFVHVFAN